tara:strand:- start:143 stop:502 length:360 start_codon:yes stop_codon:yes gene_type:complete
MPTKKRRIGFIPRIDVLKIISRISKDEKLSNSKVVNILIEESLYARGLIKKIEKNLLSNEYKEFVNNINHLETVVYDDSFKFDNGNEVFEESKNNSKIYKIFIQFLHFKKMMNIFEKYD